MSRFPWWKSMLLGLYYHGTCPGRWWCSALQNADGCAPVMVLFYHRVADDRANSWTTSTSVFARQMRWLKRRFEMVSLAEAQQRLASGENRRPTVSITFDDGYADNCRFALPLLEREKIPYTYFVASQHILSGEPFPHDVALRRPSPPNTRDEIRALADAGVEIGAHTRTHADLGLVWDAEQLYDELVTSRSELQELTGRPVRYFAFPYGQHANLSQAAYRMAKAEGFAGVCSAYGGYNFPGDDPYHLQRIHADDDLLRLKNWVTYDPRKAARTRRFLFDARPDTCNSPDTLAPAGAVVS